MALIGLALLGVLLLVARDAVPSSGGCCGCWCSRCSARRSANQLGWFAAEVGRQPWIVYGLLRTSDGPVAVVAGRGGAGLADPVRPDLPAAVRGVRLPARTTRSSTGRIEADLKPTGKLAGHGRAAHELPRLARPQHHLVRPGRRAVHRLRDAGRLRPGRRARCTSSPGPTRSGGSCSTPSARCGTATRSGWSPAAARCSPRFPNVYATVFSGFYLAFMLLLVALIFRAVAIEFRSKQPMRWWRQMWDVGFCGGQPAVAAS